MAFHAKQFMSLFLLLIISRLILSTHAAGRLFSQYGRTPPTTTTSIAAATTAATDTNPTDQKPDNLQEEYPEGQEQPRFYPNQGARNGLGTSPPPPPPTPSFRPLNYDPNMYTTSQATQKNMYNQKNDESKTVAEQYGAYNSFSNSKFDEQQQQQQQNDENKEEIPSTHNYKDSSNQFPQGTQTTEPDQYDPSASQKYSKSNDLYNKNNDDEVPATTKNPNNYNKNLGESNEQYDPYASQKFIESNEFYSKNPFSYNKFNQEQINEEKYISGTPPTANQFGNKDDDKNNNKFDAESWYETRYSKANQKDEDEMEEDPLDAEEEGKNKLPSKFYSKSNNYKYDEEQYRQENEAVAAKYTTHADLEDAELEALLDDPKDKNDKSTVYKNNQWQDWPAYNQNQKQKQGNKNVNEWQAYNQKQKQDNKNVNEWQAYNQKQKNVVNEWQAYNQKQKQGKDDTKNFAYTDAELNALLDQEEKEDEDEMESEPSNNKLYDQQNNGQYGWNKNDWAQTPYKKQNTFTPPPPSNYPQGLSDTRLMGQHYNVDKEKFDGNGIDPAMYRTAFSGNAMAEAFANANKNP